MKAPRIFGFQILDRDRSRVDPGPGSFTSRVADVMVRKSISLDGFLQTLIRRPGLNTGSFFFGRAGSQVTDQVASARSSPGPECPGLIQRSSERTRLTPGFFYPVAKIHPARRTRTHEVAKIVGWWLCVWGNANK